MLKTNPVTLRSDLPENLPSNFRCPLPSPSGRPGLFLAQLLCRPTRNRQAQVAVMKKKNTAQNVCSVRLRNSWHFSDWVEAFLL